MGAAASGVLLAVSVLVLGVLTAWWFEQRLVVVRSLANPATARHGRTVPWRWRMPMAIVRRAVGWRGPRPPDDADVARWCDALARAIRAGDTLVAAVRSVEPPAGLRPHVAPVVLALDRGASLGSALNPLRRRSPGLDAASTVIRACATLGGPSAEPLDRVATTLRRRVSDTAERRAQSAQARLSATVLTILPGSVLGLMLLASSNVRANVSTPVGLASMFAGGTLNAVGWLWMRRLIGSAA